jgi:hypothetical protein
VLKALGKVAARHIVDPRPCAPFVYIETTNEPSRTLFTSLGFTKCNDVVWAGLKLNTAS